MLVLLINGCGLIMTSEFTHSFVDSLKAMSSAQKLSIQSTLAELLLSQPYVRATAAHAVNCPIFEGLHDICGLEFGTMSYAAPVSTVTICFALFPYFRRRIAAKKCEESQKGRSTSSCTEGL
eukprot:IDg4382t1